MANYGLFDSSVLWGFFRIWEIAYHGSRRQAVVTFYRPFNSTFQRSKRKIEQKNQTVKKLKFPQINRASNVNVMSPFNWTFFLSGSPVLTWSYALGFQLLGRSLGAKVSSLFSLKPKIHEHYDLRIDFYYFCDASEASLRRWYQIMISIILHIKNIDVSSRCRLV